MSNLNMLLRGRSRARVVLPVLLILVAGSYWVVTQVYDSKTKIAILTTDTRQPSVGLDPTKPLSTWTITTLSNYLYAQSIGAKYVYYQVEAPATDGKLPAARYRPEHDGYCEHRTFGWRTSHFCKMPFVWWFMRTNPDFENIVFIDSDALFRSPDIHVKRHLDLLSRDRPFGVLTNQPWDDAMCSGYWFMYRPKGKRVFDVEDFVLEWWNEDWADTLFQWYDQSTLRRLIGGNTNGAQVGPPRARTYLNESVVVDEWSFQLKSPDQMILHIGWTNADREQKLAQAWPWEADYPLRDRERLAALLERIDVRAGSAQSITSQMPLPGVRTFG